MADGVWRTISGRKVFIGKGQSLDEAMASSGKFKDKGESKSLADMTDDEVYQKAQDTVDEMIAMEGGIKEKIAFQTKNKEIFDERDKRSKVRTEKINKLNKEFQDKKTKGEKEYTGQDVELSDKQLNSILKDADMEMTNNIDEAIFIFKDGSMIDGEFEGGYRGTDHNVIKGLRGEKGFNKLKGVNEWAEIHMNTNVVRLVPETNYALIMKGQKLSKIQKTEIKNAGYKVEEYVERPKKK